MLISNKIETINKKQIPIRITGNKTSKFIYLLNHGLLSTKESFMPFEKLANKNYLCVTFDARGNEGSLLKPSKYSYKYVQDLKNIVMWLKNKYPNKKIIIVGSSWGAGVAIKFAKKYGQLVYNIVAWSIPHKIFGSSTATQTLAKASTSKKDTSSPWVMFWAFIGMLLLGIDTHIKLKIDYKKTTHNLMLIRLGKMKRFNVVSTKYIWSVWRTLLSAIRAIKYLNRKSNVKILYIQSSNDSYGHPKTYNYLLDNTGNRVNYLLVDEFFHAVHWETTNNLNVRMFKTITNWVELGNISFVKPEKVATQTNRNLNFSFIVSIYNAEKYLNKCVASILQNKTQDYELLLINDKSTDGSAKILKKYSKYNNVRIINHSNHKGLLSSKNTALAHAKGEWYIFVNAEDYISPNFTSNIKNHLNNIHNLYTYKTINIKRNQIINNMPQYISDYSLTSNVINNSLFDNYRFPEKHCYAVASWDFYINKLNNMKIKNIVSDSKIWYKYANNSSTWTTETAVYRSRLLHAIDLYHNPKTREIALSCKLYGHYYIELLMLSAIWFTDLKNDVMKIKYKQKVSLNIKIWFWLSKMPFIKKKIFKSRRIINE